MANACARPRPRHPRSSSPPPGASIPEACASSRATCRTWRRRDSTKPRAPSLDVPHDRGRVPEGEARLWAQANHLARVQRARPRRETRRARTAQQRAARPRAEPGHRPTPPRLGFSVRVTPTRVDNRDIRAKRRAFAPRENSDVRAARHPRGPRDFPRRSRVSRRDRVDRLVVVRVVVRARARRR